MSMRHVLIAIAGLAALFGGPAAAQEAGEFYGQAAIGAILPTDLSGDINTAASTPTTRFDDAETQIGTAFRGALGYQVTDRFRTEIELAYQAREPGDFVAGTTDIQGRINTTSLMLSGYYVAPVGDSGFRVYTGAGLGLAHVDLNVSRASGFVVSDNTSIRTAGQIRFGLERDVSDSMTLFADYTAFMTLDDSYTGFNSLAGNTAQELELLNHSVALGVRFDF